MYDRATEKKGRVKINENGQPSIWSMAILRLPICFFQAYRSSKGDLFAAESGWPQIKQTKKAAKVAGFPIKQLVWKYILRKKKIIFKKRKICTLKKIAWFWERHQPGNWFKSLTVSCDDHNLKKLDFRLDYVGVENEAGVDLNVDVDT